MSIYSLLDGKKTEIPEIDLGNQTDEEAELSKDLFENYKSAQTTWAQQVAEDRDFENGVQWTSEQEAELLKRGQAPIVVNVIKPATEQVVALLTANKPRFAATGREDSDSKTAKVFADVLAYIWEKSKGNPLFKKSVRDYYTKGRGHLLGYFDPNEDFGKGEIKLAYVDPLDLYPDPNTKDPNFQDAAHILIHQVQTSEQIQAQYPGILQVLSGINTSSETQNKYSSSRVNSSTSQDVIDGFNDTYHDKYDVIDRYSKVQFNTYRLAEPMSNWEEVDITDSEIEEVMQRQCFILVQNGQPQPIVKPQDIEMFGQLYQQVGEVFHYMMAQNPETGQPDPNGQPQPMPGPETGQDPFEIPGSTQQLMPVPMQVLVQQQMVILNTYTATKIKRVLTVGDVTVFSTVLPITSYPLLTLCNHHSNNPYPMSDVRFVRPIQEYINKIRSLIIAHATNSTNTKLLIPRGAVDRKQLEAEWGRAGTGVIEFDAELGMPIVAGPVPLPNELYKNEVDARRDIQEILGVYSLQQGDATSAPPTYRGIVSLDEFGQRRIKSKQSDLEAALNEFAKVLIEMIQAYYDTPRVFRLLDPSGITREAKINVPYDELQGELKYKLNDVTVGKYDVVVVSGSMLPSNRWAQLEYYLEMYKMGLIDRVEALKKTEVVDVEGVEARMNEMEQMKQYIAQLQNELKKVQGDLQTAHREAVSANKQVEVEKFKSKLSEMAAMGKSTQEVYLKRMADEMNMNTERLQMGLQLEKEKFKNKQTKGKPNAKR